MKRRRFFAALAGLCAAPAVAMLPKAASGLASGGLIVEFDAPGGPLVGAGALARRLRDLSRYEAAEVCHAVHNAMIIGVCERPLTDAEIRRYFERAA